MQHIFKLLLLQCLEVIFILSLNNPASSLFILLKLNLEDII